jgi:hypothetical protein
MEKTIWSYQENFDFRRDIGPNDPLYEPLESSRGEYSRRKLLHTFQLDSVGKLHPGTEALAQQTVLFGGHIGCGKSTELREYAKLFSRAYTVHHLELTKALDINNLRFSDLLIALAGKLVETFEREDLSLSPDPAIVKPVTDWFDTRIVKQERFRDIEGELKTEVKATGGLPFLASLLATVSAKIRGGASYREELRREVRDGFLQLLQHFNALISHANHLLALQSRGPMVFIIDGTDKLKREDSQTFFLDDVHQLSQIATNLIVCAPISVLLEDGAVWQRFVRVQLPMVKICDADGTPRVDEEETLISLVSKRMPLDFFDNKETLRYLVRNSGGHVRDLLRLVRACFARLDHAPISRAVAEAAVRDVSSEYQRLVTGSDWADLARIDLAKGEERDRTPDRLRMLYDLVLLEYNNYWWRSHPLVRGLPSYAKALKTASAQAGPADAKR